MFFDPHHIDTARINPTTLIAGSMVVVAAAVSAAATLLASRRSSYIGSVTSERSDWINSLRQSISELTGIFYLHLAQAWTCGEYYKSQDTFNRLSEMMALSTRISLHLRPEGVIEDNIFELLKSCLELATRINKGDAKSGVIFTNYIDLLVVHCRWLLKAEWERVKLESSGSFRRYYLRIRLNSYIRRYRYFAATDGDFVLVLSEEEEIWRQDAKSKKPDLFFRKTGS